MTNRAELPEDYREFAVVDLQKDKKSFWIVNALAFAIYAVLLVAGFCLEPPSFLWMDMDANIWTNFVLPCVVLVVGAMVYFVLHEGVHGVCMYAFSKQKPKFGARLPWYFYAGSEAYFDKTQYIVVALAPVVLLGTALFVSTCFVSGAWFWSLYMIQCVNLSGSAGDLYVSFQMMCYPADVLMQDTGTRVTVYSRATQEE